MEIVSWARAREPSTTPAVAWGNLVKGNREGKCWLKDQEDDAGERWATGGDRAWAVTLSGRFPRTITGRASISSSSRSKAPGSSDLGA
jgi:hypothetical protein